MLKYLYNILYILIFHRIVSNVTNRDLKHDLEDQIALENIYLI